MIFSSIFAPEVTIGDRIIDGNQLKWSVFHDFPAARMYSVVQEWVLKTNKAIPVKREHRMSGQRTTSADILWMQCEGGERSAKLG